jgi:hypothetical protein
MEVTCGFCRAVGEGQEGKYLCVYCKKEMFVENRDGILLVHPLYKEEPNNHFYMLKEKRRLKKKLFDFGLDENEVKELGILEEKLNKLGYA